MSGTQPADDPWGAPEDTMLTPEQSMRRLLSLPWDEQVQVMQWMHRSRETATRCWLMHPDIEQHNAYLLDRLAALSTGVHNPVESVTSAEELEAARQRGIEYGRAVGYSDGHHAGRAEGIANLADRITQGLAEGL